MAANLKCSRALHCVLELGAMKRMTTTVPHLSLTSRYNRGVKLLSSGIAGSMQVCAAYRRKAIEVERFANCHIRRGDNASLDHHHRRVVAHRVEFAQAKR